MDYYDNMKRSWLSSGRPISAESQQITAEMARSIALSEGHTQKLLFGEVQAGKTLFYLGLCATLYDLDWKGVVVIFTKSDLKLTKQTLLRVEAEFRSFVEAGDIDVHDIMGMKNVTSWQVTHQKPIILVKKHSSNIRRLIDFITSKLPSNYRVLIVDDEADFATIRYRRIGGSYQRGRIGDLIVSLRESIRNCAFLQVTATPQCALLQEQGSPFRPEEISLLPRHAGYFGADRLLGEEHFFVPVPETEMTALRTLDIRFEDNLLERDGVASFRAALLNFIVAVSILRLQPPLPGDVDQRYSMIVHVDVKKKSHEALCELAERMLAEIRCAIGAGDPMFKSLVDRAIAAFRPSLVAAGRDLPPHREILAAVQTAVLEGGIRMEVLNSTRDTSQLLNDKGELRMGPPINVFFGGFMLDRGITVPKLLAMFYGRAPKKMQQDTVQQHLRLLGNRLEGHLPFTRFYTTNNVYDALRKIHKMDTSLRADVAEGDAEGRMPFVRADPDSGIVPCAKDKMPRASAFKSDSSLIPVGFQTVGTKQLKKISEQVESLIPPDALESSRPIKVPVENAVRILDLLEGAFRFEIGQSFDWASARKVIETLSRSPLRDEDRGFCWIVARRNRTMVRRRPDGRYSNAPSSYQERKLYRSLGGGLPILALFGQKGREADGWKGQSFWWPEVVIPPRADSLFYAV